MADPWVVLDAVMAAAGILVSLRLALLVGAAAWHVGRRPRPLPSAGRLPPVSVLIPAWNEERVVEATIRNVLAAAWPGVEVLVVDDGSTDRTRAVAEGVAAEDGRVRVLSPGFNQGKARALDSGLAAARHDLLVSVDADTVLHPDALRHLVAPLVAGAADAVAANLKVGNRDGWLQRWQSLEYVVGLNLGRRAQASLGCITTIPGAAAAFRREALETVGGWSPDTTTEDTDLSLALLRAGFQVVYAPGAVAFTEAPSTLRGLVHQRTRWLRGYHQCLWKHRRAFLRLDALGVFGMPNLLFVHVLVFPLFVATLPYLGRVSGWTGPDGLLALLVGILGLDLLLAGAAYGVDREDPGELLHAPVQRLAWPFFLLFVFGRVLTAHLRGRAVDWHKLARTGAVADRALAEARRPGAEAGGA